MRAIAQLLRRRPDLSRLIAAQLVSVSGDWLLRVGLAYYVYDLTGSPLASAAMMLATFLPYVVVSSIAGVFVDRWKRTTTLVVTNLLHAAGLAPLLLVADASDIWIVFAVTVGQALIAVFFTPAEQALVPLLVTDEELPTANAVNGQVRELARLVGPAAGGIVIATGGLPLLAVLDAATFAAAALLVASIRVPSDPSADCGARPERNVVAIRSLFGEWRAGLRFAIAERPVRVVFAFTLLAMTGEGVMGSLFPAFVHDVLGGSATVFGIVVACQAIGGIVGGLVAVRFGLRVSAVRMFGVGAIAFGIVDLVMFFYPLALPALWPAVACMLVVGTPGAITMVGYSTILQRGTHDGVRGRVWGALGVVQGTGILLGAGLAGLLTGTLGIVPVIAIQGIVAIMGGVVVLASLGRRHPSRATQDAVGTQL